MKGSFEVAVVWFLDHNASLGRDLGIDNVLQLACEVRQADRTKSNMETVQAGPVIRETKTRAQMAREKAKHQADDLETALV